MSIIRAIADLPTAFLAMNYSMMFLTLLLCCIPYLLYLFYRAIRFIRMIEKIPGPKPNFLFGNVVNFSSNPDEFFLQVRQFAKDYPLGYRMWGAHIGTINLIRADDYEVVLSNMKYIEKSTIYNFLHPWLNTGLLTSTGTKWQNRRKILTPSFHFNILQRFVDVINDHCLNLINELNEECKKPQTSVIPFISKHTLNVICETAMGTTLDPSDEKQKEYRDAIYRLAPLLVERTIRPWLYYDWVFNLSPLGRLQNKLVKRLHKFTSAVIKDREANFKSSDVENLEVDEGIEFRKKKRLAMLDLLISAKNNGESIDNEGIREEVDTFMFEGHDTVSIALTFALMLLANHKTVQENIIIELDGIFGDSKRTATLEDLNNMKYMEMCLKECMRLYPSVPFISRVIHEDVQLKHFLVPGGTMAHFHIFDLHRDPEVFPDPEVFDPERFTPENAKGRHPYAYVPFSAGPRNCIGQKFAFFEMKCVVSSILRHFIMEPISTIADVKLKIDMVLRSYNDIYVKFTPRIKKC